MALPAITIITVETLDTDSVPGLVDEANRLMSIGYSGGSLRAKDGDYIKWVTNEPSIEVGA